MYNLVTLQRLYLYVILSIVYSVLHYSVMYALGHGLPVIERSLKGNQERGKANANLADSHPSSKYGHFWIQKNKMATDEMPR